MIPMGWITPICLACGNTIVLKASSSTPQTALRFAEFYTEAGLPDGALNIVMCSSDESEIFLRHRDIKGITFVGSMKVGRHVYTTATANGKRVQALGGSKNHALVLKDAPIEATASDIVNAAFGCAGEGYMALSVVIVENEIADQLVEAIVRLAGDIKVGPASDRSSGMGPLVSQAHMESAVEWIAKGVSEGAKIVLDGRNVSVLGCEKGFYLGPTIMDHVKHRMTVGDHEIFGPVLAIKRVASFKDGLEVMNQSEFANVSVIFTQSGYYAREFAHGTHGGMVGVNVGAPAPASVFPFCGHKNSFFGDLHCLGKDAYRFYTESKVVTVHWSEGKDATQTAPVEAPTALPV
jgi:malonate-semialdehyde dehydrogenase (acetylating)/methylmalonate-semialdehyde dehydrogenase